MPKIILKGVSVTYKTKKESTIALDSLSGELEDSFNVILGYSGCGKTTLLKTLAGLVDYEGDIFFGLEDVKNIPTNKRNMAMVSQQYILYPTMTIFDNIAFPLKLKGCKPDEIIRSVKDIAEKLSLTHCLTRKPRQLSGGQQQRVAIARALVKEPSICLLDEPLSNIDPHLRSEERLLIKTALKESGCTVVYVTHDLNEAMALADNLVIMDEGKIVISGNPLDVYNSDNEVITALKEGSLMPKF